MSKLRNTQTSNKKAADNCEYHERTLKYFQQKCAYHSNQIITSFCKNQECLLPVCPTCIKLHSDQHKLLKTTTNFQEITKVMSEIDSVYESINDLVERVKKLLVSIQGNKKDNEQKIRGKLIEHRNILIKEFEQSLISIENKLIEAIVNDDKQFIQQIQKIDTDLSKMQFDIKRDVDTLHSEDILKQIILYYSKHSAHKYQSELESLKQRSEDLVKKSIIVTVDEGQLSTMCKAISRYMNIEITDYSSQHSKK